MRRKLLHLCLLGAMLFLLAFSDTARADYTYTTNSDNTVTITGYSGYLSGAVTIPDSILVNGVNLPVTGIGYNAFNYQSLTSAAMGTNLTSIGIDAFSYCTGLKNVTIGPNVTGIGNFAFNNCTKLSSITIPNSVTFLGSSVFWDCTSLSSATLGNNITNISNYTFEYCTSLTNVKIGSGVASIGGGVFTQCPLIAITVDPQNQFYCSVNGVFFDKNQTKLILYPIGQGGSSYTIPDSVTNIGDNAFYDCGSLTSITIPNGVTLIGNSAFSACSGLTNVIIGNSVTSLGTSAFQGCGSLTSITLPNSVSSIGQFAFYNCTALENVTIGKGIVSIVGGAFLDCYSLQSVYFQGNAPSSSESFSGDNIAMAYYLPGTLGWSSRFGDPYGLPTALWFLPNPLILNNEPSFGIQTNGFSFIISWATNTSVIIEVSTNFANTGWQAIQTNALIGGTNYFSDLQWTNYSSRFYRIRSQ